MTLKKSVRTMGVAALVILVASGAVLLPGWAAGDAAACPQDDAAHTAMGEAADDEEACEKEVSAGTIDDGAEYLPAAKLPLAEAIEIARQAASGAVGEVDLEYFNGRLVFNIDIGESDVKVDSQTGEVLNVAHD